MNKIDMYCVTDKDLPFLLKKTFLLKKNIIQNLHFIIGFGKIY